MLPHPHLDPRIRRLPNLPEIPAAFILFSVLSCTSSNMEFFRARCHELRNPMSSMLQSSEYALQLLDAHIEHGRPLDLEVLRELQKTIMMCMAHQKRVVDDCLNCMCSFAWVHPLHLLTVISK